MVSPPWAGESAVSKEPSACVAMAYPVPVPNSAGAASTNVTVTVGPTTPCLTTETVMGPEITLSGTMKLICDGDTYNSGARPVVHVYLRAAQRTGQNSGFDEHRESLQRCTRTGWFRKYSARNWARTGRAHSPTRSRFHWRYKQEPAPKRF